MRAFFSWFVRFVAKTLVLMFAFIVVVSYFAGVPGKDLDKKGKKVAVVTLGGVIEESAEFLRGLHKEIADENVIGVVLRINSPGGAVGPSQEIYREVQRLKAKKPIVASMSTVAASGGLYAAIGASKIYALQGTLTGSIGVILSLPNLTKIAEKVGVTFKTIKAGKLKDTGNSFREMTSEEEQYLQALAGLTHDVFIKDISEARSLELDKVRGFADGRILLGNEALELGLIDELGSMYDAAREVHRLAGSPLPEGEEPKLKVPKEPFDEFKELLENMSPLRELYGAAGSRLRLE